MPFANNMSTDIKLSKADISKIIQRKSWGGSFGSSNSSFLRFKYKSNKTNNLMEISTLFHHFQPYGKNINNLFTYKKILLKWYN